MKVVNRVIDIGLCLVCYFGCYCIYIEKFGFVFMLKVFISLFGVSVLMCRFGVSFFMFCLCSELIWIDLVFSRVVSCLFGMMFIVWCLLYVILGGLLLGLW